MRLFFLDADQKATLEAQLSEVLSGDQLLTAIAAIDMVCANAQCARSTPENERRRERDQEHAHFSRLAINVEALRRDLQHQRPEWGTIGVDWSALDDVLSVVAQSSAAEAAATAASTSQGRPPKDWRDRVVAVVFHAYPDGDALKSRDSHFERTVQKVLEFLDDYPVDVHSLVIDSLARRPDPPFTVQLKRPLRIIR